MILFFYNFALLAVLVMGSPWWLWRIATTRKYRDGLKERLGWVRVGRDGRFKGQHVAVATEERPLIWVHAVSVGEVLAVSRLVKTLDVAWPEYFVAISTTTRTGQELARERFGSNRVFYCPLDLPWAVRAYLNALKPRMLVLAETEFWPNLLSGCFRRGIPVAVVNARISDRSWPRYRRLRRLWEPFLRRLSTVLAQSDTDAERLRAIGCAPERVSVAGNLKFDVRSAEEADATIQMKARGVGLRFVVAGSTLEGEETALLEAWPKVLQPDPRLVMVLAPRHPERFAGVAALLERSGLGWEKRSDWRSQAAGTTQSLKPGAIVLLDTIGELSSVYSLASVAFVGGSLIPAGGHNPLEPAQFGVPIVMGSNYANFRAIVEDLRAHDGIWITAKEDLANTLIELIQDGATAKAMGLRAKQVFDQQAGATERTVRALQALLVTGSDTL
jgi:3-deoxy-D-manno-octulosonic-acid transferase